MRAVLLRLTLLVASIAVAALLAEGLVLAVLGEQPKFPRRVVGAPFGVRINEPDVEYRHQSADVTVWFRINSEGMRADREYPLEKPPGVVRIVALGDSFTIGYEVPVEDTFASVLERELRAGGLSVEVLNAGVSGYSTAEEYLYFTRRLVDYQPDIALVAFYGNDLADNVRTNLFAVREGGLVQTAETYVPGGGLGDALNRNPVLGFLSGYSNAFAAAKEGATRWLKSEQVDANLANTAEAAGAAQGNAPSYDRVLGASIFEEFYRAARARGIPLVILALPMVEAGSYAHIDVFPTELFDVRRPGIVYVSGVDALYPWYWKEPLYYHRSHGHFTPLAHRVLGETLAREIAAAGLVPAAPRAASAEK